MKPHIQNIEIWQLAMALVFVMSAGAASIWHKLKLERDLVVGTVRTVSQLFLLGYALTFIFQFTQSWLVILTLIIMITFAAFTVRARVGERDVPFFLPTLVSMLASYLLVTLLVCAVIVGAKPWWEPQYFIPLGGMVVGNSMNAIAITLDRLFSELRSRRGEVEMRLCLGANYREASEDLFRSAIKAGMIPTINSMMAVGIVFIPGMMTGQILAGADPLLAIRYQIVVMLMLIGSTTLGSLLVAYLARRLCFGEAHELKLRPSQ